MITYEKVRTRRRCLAACVLVWGCAGTRPAPSRPRGAHHATGDRRPAGGLVRGGPLLRDHRPLRRRRPRPTTPTWTARRRGRSTAATSKGCASTWTRSPALGATALWITPVVKNIDGFVTGAGFPDWAYHGYWADDFLALDPRFGSEAELKALVDGVPRAAGSRSCSTSSTTTPATGRTTSTDPKTKGWLRYRGRRDLRHGRPDVVRGRAARLQDRAARGAPTTCCRRSSAGRRGRASTASASTPSSTSTTPFWTGAPAGGRASELGQGFFLLGEVWGGDAQVARPLVRRRRDGRRLRLLASRAARSAFVQGRGRTVAFDRYLKSREKVRAGLPAGAVPLLARRARGALPARRRHDAVPSRRASCS